MFAHGSKNRDAWESVLSTLNKEARESVNLWRKSLVVRPSDLRRKRNHLMRFVGACPNIERLRIVDLDNVLTTREVRGILDTCPKLRIIEGLIDCLAAGFASRRLRCMCVVFDKPHAADFVDSLDGVTHVIGIVDRVRGASQRYLNRYLRKLGASGKVRAMRLEAPVITAGYVTHALEGMTTVTSVGVVPGRWTTSSRAVKRMEWVKEFTVHRAKEPTDDGFIELRDLAEAFPNLENLTCPGHDVASKIWPAQVLMRLKTLACASVDSDGHANVFPELESLTLTAGYDSYKEYLEVSTAAPNLKNLSVVDECESDKRVLPKFQDSLRKVSLSTPHSRATVTDLANVEALTLGATGVNFVDATAPKLRCMDLTVDGILVICTNEAPSFPVLEWIILRKPSILAAQAIVDLAATSPRLWAVCLKGWGREHVRELCILYYKRTSQQRAIPSIEELPSRLDAYVNVKDKVVVMSKMNDCF